METPRGTTAPPGTGSLLERRLLVVSGKGGVGKSTLAAALGVLAARRGLRTIVAEVSDQSRLASLCGITAQTRGAEIELRPNLSSISIDPDRALLEWLQALGGRVPGRLLASSATFRYFSAAAPGAKELVTMVKVQRLTLRKGRAGPARVAAAVRPRAERGGYDLVLLDAPATGHALAMLRSPHTFGAIARVGPIAAQAQKVAELLADPQRCGYVAVADGSDMAVSETLELQDGLQRGLGRSLSAVLVNAVLPQRFSTAELRRLEQLGEDAPAVARSAVAAARAVHERARIQHNQLARLRRRKLPVLPVPFQFVPELDLASVERIAELVGRRL